MDFRPGVMPVQENSIKSTCIKEVCEGCSFDVKTGEEKPSLIPRNGDESVEGPAQPLPTVSSGFVTAAAASAKSSPRVNTGTRLTFPFQ